jgi:4-amino-4-deoxy-L-arabinose transferase-like glycosyltransferase
VSREHLILIAVCSLTLFAGLGRPPITDSDEAFYAEGAREMVDGGDWLTPHFNYENRFEKPVLYYWLVASTYTLLGVDEGSARLPSALAGLSLALLTFFLGRRWFNYSTGLLAGLIIATCFGCVVMARQALPDLTLTFFVTLATYSTLTAWLDPPNDTFKVDKANRRWHLAMAAVAVACGFLTKGPVALALPCIVVAPILFYEYWAQRSRCHISLIDVTLGLGLFLLLTAPWFLGMTLVHGVEYAERFFLAENFDRFVTARYNAPRPWWYYVPIVIGGLFPWSLYMPLWLPRLWKFATRRDRIIDLTTARLTWWALAPLLFYTLSVGKQPRYILPMLCPLALLLAATICARLLSQNSWRDYLMTSCTILTGGVLVTLGILIFRARVLFSEWSPHWITVVAASVALSGLIVCLTAAKSRWTAAAVAFAAILTTLGAHYVVLASPGPAPVERIASLLTEARQNEELYGRHGVFNRNLVFYTRAQFLELPILRAADDLLRQPDRVLCVLRAEDAKTLRDRGLTLIGLGEVTYVDTGSLNFRTFLSPNPDHRQRVVLVANR